MRRSGQLFAVNTHDPFRAQRLGELESLAVGIGYDLCEPIVIAQINEQDPAMIANAVAPSGQANGNADVAVSKRAAGV